MSKDQFGHGSEKHAAQGGDAAHQAARRSIQQNPDSPNPAAEAVLTARGYGAADIQRLRQNAGAAVSDSAALAAHQSGITMARAVPRSALKGVEVTSLRALAGV